MSEINLKAELKKGYLMFRAFEHGVELAEKLSQIEGDCIEKEKIIAEFSAKEKAAKSAHDASIAELDRQLKVHKDRAEEAMALIDKESSLAKDTFKKLLSEHSKKEAKIIENIKSQEAELLKLNNSVETLSIERNKIIAEIEETKTKFRNML